MNEKNYKEVCQKVYDLLINSSQLVQQRYNIEQGVVGDIKLLVDLSGAVVVALKILEKEGITERKM